MKIASGLVLNSTLYGISENGRFQYTEVGRQCFRECFAVVGINIDEIESAQQHRQALKSVIDKQKKIRVGGR